MFQNNETPAILLFQTNPMGVGLFSYVKNSFVVSHNNFIFIDKFILFCKQCPFVILIRKSFIRQGENRPKQPNSYGTMGIYRRYSLRNKPGSCHCLVCAFIEVSAMYRFCYKPNLTVLKSCMMLSSSSIMVLCFGRDL